MVDTLFLDPITYINDVRTRNSLRVLQFVDARAELLNASAILDQAALDPYAFQRDSYLQYRDKLINDGDAGEVDYNSSCLLYTSPSPRDKRQSRMPSSA